MTTPPPSARQPGLWRSYEELTASPEVRRRLADEFPALKDLTHIDRRALMRLMGASLGLAGLAACSNDQPFGDPLLSHPANTSGHTPGEPLYFATSLELGGYGRGALVRSHDGRPVKIEGNPLHPASLGATDIFMQAEVLSLYDPDRSRHPRESGAIRSWSQLRRALLAERAGLRADGGRGLHILLGVTSSPTVARLVARLRTLYPEVRFHAYAPITGSADTAFDRPAEAVYAFDRADAVFSLGHDFLGPGPAQVRYGRDWIERRRSGLSGGRAARLLVAEATPTLTGAKADRRFVLSPADYEPLARAVAGRLGIDAGGAIHPLAGPIAAELERAGSGALMLAGHEAPPAVHALAHAVNERLGGLGRTVRYVGPVLIGSGDGVEPLASLTRAMAADRVSRLLVLDGNPAYDAPVDLGFGGLASRVPFSLHLGTHYDETARACRWHAPKPHVLESWGDLRAFEGTVGLQQPATMPLLPGFGAIALLALLAGERADAREAVQATWIDRLGGEAAWLAALEAGVVPGTEAQPIAARAVRGLQPDQQTQRHDGFRILFRADGSVWDGRFANNAWLQELPRQLTKLVWSNAALIAPAAAERLGLANGDVIEIRRGGRRTEAPAWITPGQAPDTITLPLGYGRLFAGEVGSRVGFNPYPLRTTDAPWIADAEVRPLGRRVDLVSTQAHHDMTDRDVVRTVAATNVGRSVSPAREQASFYPEYRNDDHAWGMVIDLDACIGCNACTIACQSENNIPVVGPEEVARGREMHWIRVDRYYDGNADNPGTSFMPVPCMHCEKAPCEVVCPVNATVHSSDGLNQMVYNRCIGTRTCSNNCPYKVRRFNFFEYAGDDGIGVPAAVKNPRVTVRDRGVMEKCTYCVQRINAARIEADIENRPIRDGELQTACQQVCPTSAIVFGDLNNPNSAVSRLAANPRNYALLGELNTQPRTTYLAKVASGDPEADDAASG